MKALKMCNKSDAEAGFFILNEILRLIDVYFESRKLCSEILFKKLSHLIEISEGDHLVMTLNSLKKIIQSNQYNDSLILR